MLAQTQGLDRRPWCRHGVKSLKTATIYVGLNSTGRINLGMIDAREQSKWPVAPNQVQDWVGHAQGHQSCRINALTGMLE